MLPTADKVGEEDASKMPEAPVTVEIPSPREQTTHPIGNRVRTSSSSPESATSESQDRSQKPRLWASDIQHTFSPLQTHDGVSSWSASSDKQLGSPGSASDRVFPIRSVISVDSSQTPYTLQGRNSSEQQEYFPPGAAAPEIVGSHQSRQSFSEANGKPTPRTQQHPVGFQESGPEATENDLFQQLIVIRTSTAGAFECSCSVTRHPRSQTKVSQPALMAP
jgi:hypothetical protein